MKLKELTVQDCVDMHEKQNREFTIENGKVVSFTARKGEGYGLYSEVGHAHKDNSR